MKKSLPFAALLLALGLFSALSSAQNTEFGKNKVQYRDFDWYYIQSNHFDVYFSQGGDYLAAYAADMAESSYAAISKSFRYQIFNRITVVVYNSHNDFQQTNVVNEYLEEGIGGVTELFKNRVVLPFEGDYAKFRHVIHHELVHAVLNDMFYGGSIQSIISNNISLQLPIWFNEGLAEWEALRWDTNSDMFLRDATIHEYLPPIPYLNGYMAYRGGESMWNFIATKYGDEKISEILMRIRGSRNVDQGFRSAIGLSIDELSERWQKEQKVLYWPDIAKRQEPADYARKLTDHTKDGSFYNTSPSISPQGDKIAFISNRDDYFDVYIMNAIDGSTVDKVVDGQRTADFEELHLLTPGMSWSPDGSRLALAAKSGDQDALIVIDVKSGKQEKIEFNLDGIFSVDWSPDGDKICFTGNDKQQSDVYVYDLKTKQLTNLTEDIFSDGDPNWSPDGKTIYFSSDRASTLYTGTNSLDFKMQQYQNGQKDLYALNVENRSIRRLTDLPLSDETSPASTPDGKHLFFISDLNGINNIYYEDLTTDSIRPVTNSLAGVYQLSLSRDGNKLAFGSLSNGGFDIFLMRMPLEHLQKTNELEPTEFVKTFSPKYKTPAMSEAPKDTISLSDDVTIRTEAKDTTGVYDDKMRVDLRNYVFNETFDDRFDRKKDTARPLTVANNIDKEGRYIVNKYKLNFTPDIVYGNAGFNTFYGVQGSTIMAFSDMLGNHQIYLLTNLLIDLKNSDYAIAYLYLPKRIDYGIQAFHSARFILLDDAHSGGSVYRFRNYGVSVQASYPFDKFNRIEGTLSWLNLTRENIDYNDVPAQYRTIVYPGLSYIHDNTLWGYISPVNGERYNFTVLASPKFNGSEGLGFYTITADVREYYKAWRNYTLAVRLAGGGSFGPDPQRFVIGGIDNWINRQFENDHIPLDRAEDFVFLTSGVPLRGYNYNARIGTKYAVTNLEFRFPFFGYVMAGPLPVFFQSLNGVFFLDVGGAWTGRDDFRAFDKDASGNTYMKDLLAGTGYGVRMIFLGFLLKLDVAYSYDLQGFSSPKYYFSLGGDF